MPHFVAWYRVARESDLASVGGDLDDAAAALVAQVGQREADEVDRGGEVGGDDALDLLVGELLCSAEQPVAGVADDHVYAAELRERTVDHTVKGRGVGDVEHLCAEGVGVALEEVCDLALIADGADHAVGALEELLGHLTAEAAAYAGDEPGALCHRDSPLGGGRFSFQGRGTSLRVDPRCAASVMLSMMLA